MSVIDRETPESAKRTKDNLRGWIAFSLTVIAGTALYYEMRNPSDPLDSLMKDQTHFTVFAKQPPSQFTP